MGMDITGKSPTTEEGSYFRNNVWWWHPLWSYCEQVYPKCEEILGHSNDGDGLDEQHSLILAKKLRHLLKTGETTIYEKDRKVVLDELPDEECHFCNGTGERHDKVVDGKCNCCNGKGKIRPWDIHYPFSVKNVEKFCLFLEGCGGFKIN